MASQKSYGSILKSILQEHSCRQPSHGKIEVLTVFDDESGRYGLVDVGWDRGARVHSLIFLARLQNGNLRIEWDGIGYGITEELIAAGIPEADIEHAWMEPCPQEALPERKRPLQPTS